MHKDFWLGKGPSLILIPPARDMNEIWQVQIYDTADYEERFYNPGKMWENETARARPVINWPTDGIPTVRPNLGVIFIPAIAGQKFEFPKGQMPWCKEPLSQDAIRAVKDIDVTQTELMRLAEDFYRIHKKSSETEIIPYHPDTQGIFDIAHLLYGENIFYDITDENKSPWLDELLDISMDLMVRAADHIKKIIGENQDSMTHGHGTEQGIFFPNAGLRISEDAPTMISPEMIDRFVIDRIEQCAEEFGGIFMHYCGKHEYFFERLCRCPEVKAIDIGNPEAYDTTWLFEIAAKTNTVLYTRINALENESWTDYTKRLAALTKQTSARLALRPLAYPKAKQDAQNMLDLWHELTQ